MTIARQVLAVRTYLLTRRCTQRQLLLRPEGVVEQIFLYCLGEAVARYGITLHGFIAMSNHEHLIVRDNEGKATWRAPPETAPLSAFARTYKPRERPPCAPPAPISRPPRRHQSPPSDTNSGRVSLTTMTARGFTGAAFAPTGIAANATRPAAWGQETRLPFR